MNKKIILTIISSLLFSHFLFAADSDREWRKITDLRGQWKFSIGDNPSWAQKDFDDSDWANIFAPSNWEDEGYPGYDGYAWYRKKFKISKISNLYIHIGFIDDVDEVYINGTLIGNTGSFPPDYYSGYNFDRVYQIPSVHLNENSENVIAIRVYDDQMEGGLVNGKLGIYEKLDLPLLIKSFEGHWKFSTGDGEERAEYNFNDSHWDNIYVPGSWEAQGYSDYDGYAWYRLHFRVDTKYKNEKLVMVLGKIDDLDETYLNGSLLGRTGKIYDNPKRIDFNYEWMEMRTYIIDNGALNFDGENVLAVRVYDGWISGGIFEGPVGIITYKEYLKWKKSDKNKNNIFLELFNYFKDEMN